jgi:hypothetical protein
MPSTSPRTARHTFATSGPPRPGAFAPAGAPRRVTSRSLNDAVIRRGTPPPARPRTTAGPTLLVFLTSSGQSLSTACVQFSQGVMDGLGDSLKGTWGLLSHDMWQLATYREMGTTLTALGLLDPLNVAQSLAAARALDVRLGTHVARRMADIINAVKQLMRDAPHWTARQWGRAVGRVIGDLVLAKGATGGAKLAASSATTLNRVAATRYLARTPSFAEAFSEVKGFNVGVGQRSFKVQEELKRARTGRWLSNQRMATPAETALKLALDYPGSLNRASRRWTVRRFGIYVEGTVASQHNPLGGGGHQLLRVMGREAGYVEVPYK